MTSRAQGACSREEPQPKFDRLMTNLFAGDVPLRVEPVELQALEQIGLEGLPRDFRQVLRRYDFVRVDVRPVEKENASTEILHAYISFAIRYVL